MKKLHILLLISIILTNKIYSQSAFLQSSAINASLGNSTATLSNYGSLNANVAGLADLKDLTLSSSFKFVENAAWQNTLSANAYVPFKIGTAGIGVNTIGDDIFNQQLISLGFANRFGIASIGLKANYLQYNIEGLTNKGVTFFDMGGIVELTPQLFVGAYILNLTQTKLSSFENEHYPTIIDAGLSFRPSEKLMINVEIEQDIDFEPTFKAGISYIPIKNLSLRTGINTSPNRQFAGIGFNPNNILLNFDYSLSNDKFYGIHHQLSISYRIKRHVNEAD